MRIGKDGEILVSAPYLCPKRLIESFVEEHREWIDKALARSKARKDSLDAFYGRMDLSSAGKRKDAAARLSAIVFPLAEHYAAAMGVRPSRISYRPSKTRWGSCNPRTGSINFSLYLLLLPKECIEHTVVHELAHLIVRGHGPAFHDTVGRYFPKWKEAGRLADACMKSPTLVTERLTLRPWRESDAESLYRHASDPRIGPMAGWDPHTSVEYSLGIIRTVFFRPETYAVCLKGSDEAIGCIGIMRGMDSSLGLPQDEAELGYWLAVPYWGRGLIPEAAMEIERRSFEELGIRRLWCTRFRSNGNSGSVQRKCGFRQHSSDSDIITSCLERKEWTRLHG